MGVCLDWKGGVCGWAIDDEGCCECVDCVEGEGSVEGTGPGVFVEQSGLDPGLVTRFGGEDCGCSCEVFFVGDILRCTEVSTDAYAFENRRQSDEGLGVGIGAGKW